MNQLKTTAFVLLAAFCFSCEKYVAGEDYANSNIALTASQVVPPSASTATGNMNARYNTQTKTLSYTISWNNLSGAPTAIHIHGLADAGTIAVSAPIGSYPSSGAHQGVAQNLSVSGLSASGSLTNALFADGVVIKEEDLLAGKFYVDIHTTAEPAGAIRGQIVLQKQ